MLQSDLISSNSFVNRMFSFLSRSFSSNSSAGDELDEITCSSAEFDGDTISFAGGIVDSGSGDRTAAVVVAVARVGGVAGRIFRRCISQRSRFSPLRKYSFENSQRSGTTFLNPYKLTKIIKSKKRKKEIDREDDWIT